MKNKTYEQLKAKAESYLANAGYGSGTNYTTSQVAGIMALFTLKELSQPSEKPAIEEIFCPYCGIEKEHIIPSDANSGRVCRYSLCRGGVIISQEKPTYENIIAAWDSVEKNTQAKEKPSAEEWLDQEFGDAYIEADGWGDIKFLSIGKVIEALNQYAKQ